MTSALFFITKARISGIVVEGHSGYAEQGEDILCSAISSAVCLAEAVVNDVLAVGATVRVEEGYLSLSLPAFLEERAEQVCQSIFAGLLLHFQQLSQEYPDNFQVLEEEISLS